MGYVLVIEDDVSISYLLQLYISIKGIACIVTSTIAEVETCLQDNGPPSIVLLDYVLEEQDPYLIIGLIKSYHNNITICLMTAISNPEVTLKHLNLTCLLKKPFILDDLDNIISSVIGIKSVL